MTAASRPPILLIGLEPEVEKLVADLLKNTEVTIVPMDVEKLLDPVEIMPCIVICGTPKGVSANELAQSLRMNYQSVPIFLCCTERQGFERALFVKNGFTDAFFIPVDTANLRVALSEALALATNGAIRVFRAVKMIDVEPGSTLDFDTSVFMPVNRKYIKVSNSGDSLDAERVEKLKKGKMSNIFVPVEQMKSFYDYSAKRLKTISTGTTMSATERREKLSGAVRELISGLFSQETSSFESGQGVMKDCGEIVKSFIIQGADAEWYSRIQQVLGEKGDAYSHSGNVSTLAALFSMGLGIGKPEDLALAGLLHDVGIAELPADVQLAKVESMTPAQLTEYHKHPQLSVNMIRSRKISVPEIVTKAIMQHHELFNGQGYPNGLFGDRICKEAQILALADQFDYLTRAEEGRALMTPTQAVEQLRNAQVNDPSKIHYNPELLGPLLNLFSTAGSSG